MGGEAWKHRYNVHPLMPDRTECPHGGKVGFVRRKHFIKGGKGLTVYYCGACNRSWETEEEKDPPQSRSRSWRVTRRHHYFWRATDDHTACSATAARCWHP